MQDYIYVLSSTPSLSNFSSRPPETPLPHNLPFNQEMAAADLQQKVLVMLRPPDGPGIFGFACRDNDGLRTDDRSELPRLDTE